MLFEAKDPATKQYIGYPESGFWPFLVVAGKWLVGMAAQVMVYIAADSLLSDDPDEAANELAAGVEAEVPGNKEFMKAVLSPSTRKYYAETSGFLTGYIPRGLACGMSPASHQNMVHGVNEFVKLIENGEATTIADVYVMRAALEKLLQANCVDPQAEHENRLPPNPATGFAGDPGWHKLNPGGQAPPPVKPPAPGPPAPIIKKAGAPALPWIMGIGAAAVALFFMSRRQG